MSHAHTQSALIEANCRLNELRAALHSAKNTQTQQHTKPASSDTEASVKCTLPAHLGWGVMRTNVSAETSPLKSDDTQLPIFIAPAPAAEISLPTTIRVYPSLLTAMLRQEFAAIGRVWLLIRALDQEGKGWVHIKEIRERLTNRTSDWRIVGWRRMRQLLQQGKGVLWDRDEFGRVWLYGAARVAKALDVTRLDGNPVNLPVNQLLSGIQNSKAFFYAAFHAGRKTSNPISRATLQKITGVSETTQRTYEISTGTTSTKNYCVSNIPYTLENVRSEVFKRPVVLAFTDKKTGQKYISWPLPNNYKTTLQTACHGRQRKINRQLKYSSDLVIQRRGGTDEHFGRIFCTSAKQAMHRTQKDESYWYDKAGRWCKSIV